MHCIFYIIMEQQSGEVSGKKEEWKPSVDAPEFLPWKSEELERGTSEEARCVWIGNISTQLSDEELLQVLERFGNLQKMKRIKRSNCAFITFESAESAMNAKDELDGAFLFGKRLELNVIQPSRHLWIGNVNSEVNENDLLAEFEKFGQVDVVKLMGEYDFAQVSFVNLEDAIKAKQGNHKVFEVNYRWDNSFRDQFRRSRPRQLRQKASRQLYVANISASSSITEVLLMFSPFGIVETVKDYRDRGYVFVVYKKVEDAISAFSYFQQQRVMLNDLPLVVKFGRPLM